MGLRPTVSLSVMNA